MRQFFFANFPEHLYVLGSCKKGALVQQLLLQIMISIKMGQPHVMQLSTVMFFANDHPDGLAACRKDGLPGQFFLYSDRICKFFEEPVAWKRRSSGRH